MQNKAKYDLIRPEYFENLKQTGQLYKKSKLTNVQFYVILCTRGILSLLKYRLLCFPVLLVLFPPQPLHLCIAGDFFGYYSGFEN